MECPIDFVVKLGGSAVTKKDEFETVKSDEIRKVAEILFQCWQNKRTFVIVHGAGSFGHHQARQYGVKQGIQTTKSNCEENRVKIGFCLTRLSVCMPCGQWTTAEDHVITHPCKQLSKLINAGYVPVLHGDCVLDEAKNCTILSGDTVCEVLCDYYKPPLMVFASDVAGVYDKPPQTKGAKLLRHICVSSEGIAATISTENDTDHDVTGGIQFKLDSAINIVRKTNGITSVIFCNISSGTFQHVCETSNLSVQVEGTIISATKET